MFRLTALAAATAALLSGGVVVAPPVAANGVAAVVDCLLLLYGECARIDADASVTSFAARPMLDLQLAEDRADVIPGDKLGYTATVTNSGADVEAMTSMTAKSTGDTTAVVASWYEEVQYLDPNGRWCAVAWYSASAPGYSAIDPGAGAPSELIVTTVSKPASGVTYPSDGDHVLGTTIGHNSKASWNLLSGAALTPAATKLLADKARVKGLRLVSHVEVTRTNGHDSNPSTEFTPLANPLQNGVNATVTDVSVAFHLPSGTTTVTKATAPALASLAPGAVATATAYTVPVPGARGASEDEAVYAARLGTLVAHPVPAAALATGSAAGCLADEGGAPGHHRGLLALLLGHQIDDEDWGHGPPTTPAGVVSSALEYATATEHVPVVTVAKSGPANADAGTSISYDLQVDNSGDARATELALSDALPSGSLQVGGAPTELAPGGDGHGHASYAVPDTADDGPLTDTATVGWADANGNPYGPLSSAFTSQIKSTVLGSTLAISPLSAGPNHVGTSQTLTVTFTDRHGSPLAGKAIHLAIAGPNPQATDLTTGSDGSASFTYTGNNPGTDTAQATFSGGPAPVSSPTATIGWSQSAASVALTTVSGNFYPAPSGAHAFTATPADTPAFTRDFPDIAFNPPPGSVPHNTTNVGPATQPFTDVTANVVGGARGTIAATGNGLAAGSGSLSAFDAVLQGNIVVAAPGDVALSVIADDGFVLGIGNGATQVSGSMSNPPASGRTPFANDPVVGAHNALSTGPSTYPVTVHFPTAGSYPYEFDYFSSGANQRSLVLGVNAGDAAATGKIFVTGHDPDDHATGRPPGSTGAIHLLQTAVRFVTDNKPNPKLLLVTDEHDPHDIAYRDSRFGVSQAAGLQVDIADDGSFGPINLHTVDFSHYDGIIVASSFGGWLAQAEVDILIARRADIASYLAHGGGLIALAEPMGGGSRVTHDSYGYLPCLKPTDIADGNEAGVVLSDQGRAIGLVPADVTTNFAHNAFADPCGLDVLDRYADGQPLTLGTAGSATHATAIAPPAGSLLLSPQTPGTASVGDTVTFTVAALNADGDPQVGLDVDLAIDGPDGRRDGNGKLFPAHLSATTDADGVATFSYHGTGVGTDTLQASAFLTGMTAVSNTTTETWSVPPFTPPTSTPTPTPTPTVTPTTCSEDSPTPSATPSDSPSDSPLPSPTSSATDTEVASPSSSATETTSPTPTDSATDTTSPTPTDTSTPCPTGPPTPTPTDTAIVPDGAPPAITDVSPADGSRVTAPTPVTATFVAPDGNTITSWQVTIHDVDGGPTTTIGSGNGAPPATLATFDPTQLVNGTYQVKVTADASTGGENTIVSTVIVDGQLKPGRYVADYTDLTTPVAGFTMAVDRHYDSTDPQSGDFGVGWTLGLSSLAVHANRPLGAGGWVQYDASCRFGICTQGYRTTTPHTVTVTYPDGQQDIFDFTPQGLSGEDDLAAAAFTARAGTTSALAALGNTDVISGEDGSLYDEDTGDEYNPTRYRLTTHDGRVFVLEPSTGLVSATDTNGNTLSVTANGVTASSGQGLTFTRDSSGRITKITASDGRTVTYGYDGAGNLTTITDPDGNVGHYLYDAGHRMLSQTGAVGAPVRVMNYGPGGRLASITDGDGNTASLSIDPSLRSETVTDATGHLTTVLSLDALGDVVQQDQIAGSSDRTTKATYDAQGRVLTSTNALGKTTTNVYNAAGDLTSTTDPLGRKTSFTYDAADHLLTKTLPSGAVEETDTYDGNGNLLTLKRPNGATYTYGYDPAGRLTSFTDPLSRTVGLTYDTAGNPSSITDAAGDVTHIQASATGQVTSTTDPLGAVTSYGYDSRGDLTSTTNAQNQTVGYGYDALGSVISSTDPLGHATTYTRDGAGLVTSVLDRNGNQTAYVYDADGRLTKVTLADGTTSTYGYNGFGELTGASNVTETLGFGYDAAGEVSTATAAPLSAADAEPSVALAYSYDAAGEPASVTGPAGAVGYGYNPDALLNQVTDPAGGVFGIAHDANGRRTGLSRPNGVSDAYSYDAADELLGIDSTSSGGSTVAFDHYTYTANGLRASLTNGDGTTSYGYDADGQLTSASYPSASGLANESFGYDSIGDQTLASQTYDGAGRLTADATFTYTYDKEGDLLTRTNKTTHKVTSYTWNSAHQLLAVTAPDASQTSFGYDPLGRRTDVTSTAGRVHTVYNGNQPIATYNTAGMLTASFVYGAGDNEQLEETFPGSGSFYYLHDALGSVTALTTSSGAVADSYRYTAFGAVHTTGTVPNPFTYIGAPTDPTTGLVYLNARYLDPATGRFISEDPVRAASLYPYASNDPTNLADPSGREDDLAGEIEATDLSETIDQATYSRFTNPLYSGNLTPGSALGRLTLSLQQRAGDLADTIETTESEVKDFFPGLHFPFLDSPAIQAFLYGALGSAILVMKAALLVNSLANKLLDLISRLDS